MSYFSQNPLFLLLSSTPSGMKWLANIGKDKNREKISWYFYLLDFNKKLDKKNEIRSIEAEIKKIEKT